MNTFHSIYYNKATIILIAVLGLWVCIYAIIWNKISFLHKDNIALNIAGTSFSLSEIWINEAKKYNYHQIYIYPTKYELLCESQIEWLCSDVQGKKDFLDTFLLMYISRDASNPDLGNIEKEIFHTEQSTQDILKKMFSMVHKPLYWEEKEKIYQKYFEYKKNTPEDQIFLSNAEIMCIDKIRMQIPVWSYNEDTEISQRVQSECNIAGEKSNITQVNKREIQKKILGQVHFGIKISEITLLYKFYNRKNGRFEEQKEQKKILQLKENIDKSIMINEF